MSEPNPIGRIVIIPFLQGKLTTDGKLSEPDIYRILEKWMNRHPQFRGREGEFRIIRGHTHLPEGHLTDFVRVTAEVSPEVVGYDPSEDADLYEDFLAEECENPPREPHKIWIDQSEAARGIEDEFGTDKALAYLIGEKFLNFLEAAESNTAFKAELPAFVAEIKTIFEPWQLAEYLEIARHTEPIDPNDYASIEEAEMEQKRELRRSAADLLLVERARWWLLGE